ncbi:hypothetical protein BKA24_001732 [Microbacterium marinum]|uniref:Terminase-like family protein n=1 Tax=Microbacterium marinum TaxID=421115 RepID=A0A7W7BSS8_9MICO|nr:hypothetical protein [Microbacterium marinum]MBB4667023.1 hypothetical protein [Microbacterium marinum]
MLLDGVAFDSAIQELTERSKKSLYRTDFAAWLSDVMHERMYAKMAEISHDVLFGKNPRTLIKSANGTGKTHGAARWVLYWITVYPADESLAICTAPTLAQVRMGIFAYLKEAYGYQKTLAQSQGRAMPWPGWISEQDAWQYHTPGGNRVLAVARVPGASDAVSQFQGLRKTGGRNFIMLDEAGGVKEPIYRAIDKLMTSDDSRMAGIGNPDNLGTPFHERFIDERFAREYQLHTITAYETPNLTGEVVYPDNPEKERLLRSGLTSARFVFEMERMLKTGGEIVYDPKFDAERNLTGTPNGAFKSMVDGEFPAEGDNTFFSGTHIGNARAREIDPTGSRVIIGFDPAAMGGDESVVMVNRGGHCRIFGETISYDEGGQTRQTTGLWSHEDEVTAARRIHAIATHLGAHEVRIDAGGLGSGIAAQLMRLPEFREKCYELIKVDGSRPSQNKRRWANTRAENHDQLRDLLRGESLDLDPDDKALRSQLQAVTFDYDKYRAIAITPKKEMRTEMNGSPDRLDALILATINTKPLTENELRGLEGGETLLQDPRDLLDELFDPESEWYPM